MEYSFESVVVEWRGPAPFYFATVPEDLAAEIHLIAPTLTYGWGVIPATVTIGSTTITTSLFPKDGGYLVPLKDAIRKPEGIEQGATVTLVLTLGR
ncbi:MAG: DUF1905 domain-containing protein [Microbacteriaceae bacterium]